MRVGERGRVGEIESEEIDEGSCLGPPPPVLAPGSTVSCRCWLLVRRCQISLCLHPDFPFAAVLHQMILNYTGGN